MADVENVIYAIERCTCHVPDACRDCPYDAGHPYNECVEMLLKNAMELLKEQEQKHGRWVRLTGMAPPEYHGHRICSICECFAPYDPLHMGREILPKYCPGCGAKMEGEA